MFNFFNNRHENVTEGDEVMANAKLSKTAKVRNLFAKGESVTWKPLHRGFSHLRSTVLKQSYSKKVVLKNELIQYSACAHKVSMNQFAKEFPTLVIDFT